MATNAELHRRREAAVARGVAQAHPVYAARAENGEVWDVEGRRYVDFAGGIGVSNAGHRHPRVLTAIRDQLDRFVHTAFQVLPYELYVRLAERLNELAPTPDPSKTLLLSTGAEAIENAVKIARAFTGRAAVVAFQGGFHGRTLFTLAMTGKVVPYKLGFGPFPADVYHVPFPVPYRGIGTDESLRALAALFAADVEPARVAAIVLEPVLGEGGFSPAPPEFLKALRATCDAHGILLVVDEIQSGFGRTGKLFAVEHAGVAPDLLVTAKSLAGGLPLSAVVGRADAMDAPVPGGLGGTYGGNPVACAAALAVLDAIEEEGLLRRGAALGERIRSRLESLAERRPEIGEVRGLGCMLACELVRDRATREPDPALAIATVARAREHGLVLITCGTYGNVIRILVPLTAPDAVVDEGLDVLERSLEEATASR